MIRLTVYGVPIPKGSKRAFVPKGWTRAVVVNTNAKTKPWEDSIVSAAREVWDQAPLEGPVGLQVAFYLPRPKSAPKRVSLPAKKPDLGKLVRCLEDGLKRAGVYRDDAQVVTHRAEKHFAAGGVDPRGAAGVPRAEVWVYVVESDRERGAA